MLIESFARHIGISELVKRYLEPQSVTCGSEQWIVPWRDGDPHSASDAEKRLVMILYQITVDGLILLPGSTEML